MIRLFQRNMVVQVLLIVVALALLWLRPLLTPSVMEAGDHPAVLYGLLQTWLSGSARLAVVIAMVLVLAEGVVLNVLLANVNLVSQNSLLPSLVFIIAASAGTATLTPTILVGALAIASLGQLVLHGTALTIPPGKICSATALIGIATMFYQPAALLLLTYLLVAVNYRLYRWNDWLLMLLGFAAPYLVLVMVLYMTDGIAPWWQQTLASLGDILPASPTAPKLSTVPSLLIAAVFLWSLVTIASHLTEHPVLWQKNASTVLLFTVGSIGIMLYLPLLPLPVALLAVPFTFTVTHLLSAGTARPTGFGRRRHYAWLYDITLVLILVAAILC